MTEEEAEQAINRQTALYSLKLLCRCFGSDHQEAFVPALLQAVQIVTSADEEKNVTGSALLCIAEVVATLKALAIPQLPRSGPLKTQIKVSWFNISKTKMKFVSLCCRLMPAVLHTLTDRKELMTNEIYLLSAVTALTRITETLPHFISPYLQDVTLQVTHTSEMDSNV